MSDIQGAEEAPQAAPNEAEVEARKMGWVDKEEFRGDKDKWRPAEEFLDRGKRILPIVLKDNERLQRNLDRVKDDLRELRETSKQLVEFHTTAAQREYERGRREIEAKIEAAAANADASTVRAEMQNLDALTKQNTAPPKKADNTQSVQVDPEIKDWIDKNPWFNADRALNGYALDQYEALKREKPGMPEGDVLAEIKRRASSKFPEKFGINPEREGAAAVSEPSGGRAARKNAKSYENLPADAKKACDKFVKTIPGYTKEKYVADYDWDA